MNAVLLNRQEAGIKLARKLNNYQNRTDTIVLGLPRGGVPVAFEIATSLDLPLDVCLVKNLSLPEAPETTIGAVAEDALIHDYSGKLTIFNRDSTSNNASKIEAIAAQARAELRWRDRCYRHYRPMLQVTDKVAIVVDDGLTTGLTMQAAIKALRKRQPQKIVVAIPLASSRAIARLTGLADEIICLFVENSLGAVGFWYENFTELSDREVCELLSEKDMGFVGSC